MTATKQRIAVPCEKARIVATANQGDGYTGINLNDPAFRRRWIGGWLQLKSYEADLNRRLDRLMARVPSHPAGGTLQTVIRKIRRHLFVFVQNRDLTATNNGAERALRPCAVYRKITNGFRSAWGAVLYADIRSVVETARRRSIRAIDAIRLTLDERPLPTGT